MNKYEVSGDMMEVDSDKIDFDPPIYSYIIGPTVQEDLFSIVLRFR